MPQPLPDPTRLRRFGLGALLQVEVEQRVPERHVGGQQREDQGAEECQEGPATGSLSPGSAISSSTLPLGIATRARTKATAITPAIA